MYKRETVLKLALVLVPVAWLLLVGLRLWHFVHQETQPPVFDALSYVQKAQAFWAAVGEGRLFNPLNIEPNIRPFGVVFFTYPFGFHGGYHFFYFLSVFLPLLIIYLAIWNIFRPLAKRTIEQSLTFCIAVLAATAIPAAYQFALTNDANVMGAWGFVDLIFGSLGALAVSFIARSRFEPKISNAIWSSVIAVLTVFVKPAGITIMAIAFGATWVVVLWQFINREVDRRYVFKVFGVYALLYLVCGSILHHSAYFSRANIAYGESSLHLLHEMSANNWSVGDVLSKIWITYGFGVLVLLLIGLAKSFDRKYWILAFLAVCSIGGGFWLWIGRTNVEQSRYFFPFLLMAFIFISPALFRKRDIRILSLVILSGVILLPNVIIAGALFSPQSFPSVQRFIGLNLSVNLNGDIVEVAQRLKDKIKSTSRSYIVYYCGETPEIQAFEAALDWSRILGFSGGNTVPALPIDWVHEPSYRLDVLLRSDYIVFVPNSDFEKYLATHSKADDFSSEEWLIRSWLSSLTPDDGVERIYTGRVALLHVTNPVALTRAASLLVANHQWRAVFADGFSFYKIGYWDERQNVQGNLLKAPVDLSYNGEIVASIRAFTHASLGGQNSFKLYVSQRKELPNFKDAYWTVFIQEISGDGKDKGVYVPYLNGVSREGEVVVYHFSTEAESGEGSKFALGVFAPLPSGRTLSLLNPGADWGGQRTLISGP